MEDLEKTIRSSAMLPPRVKQHLLANIVNYTVKQKETLRKILHKEVKEYKKQQIKHAKGLLLFWTKAEASMRRIYLKCNSIYGKGI